MNPPTMTTQGIHASKTTASLHPFTKATAKPPKNVAAS